jgi:hypothetical protein
MNVAGVPVPRIISAMAASAVIGPLAIALLGLIEDGFDLFSGAVYFLTTLIFTLPAMCLVVVPAALALHSVGRLKTWEPTALACVLGGAIAFAWFLPNYNWAAVALAAVVGLLSGAVVRPVLLRSNKPLQDDARNARA